MRQAVLLNVDDHAAARYARGRVLSAAGYRVYDAGTGREALAILEEHNPDLILLDVHLPDINGVDLCRQIKAVNRDQPVMVMQITASALTPVHATRALDAGADCYLTEPVDPDVLLATVRAMLRLHEAERSVAHANRRLEIVNRELQRSNEDLQQFAFAASHDLQEPLRAITTYSELIEESMRDRMTETESAFLRNIRNGTGRMATLIRDLLAFSQVGREDRTHKIVDMSEVFTWALATLAGQIAETGTRIELPQNPPLVVGDSAHLGLVFQNLFSNGIKYRKKGEPAEIRVEARQDSPGFWTFAVSDSGVGIPPEYFDQIFGPFKRLHGSEIPGTGLGLALCRRIVEAHGGKIWVESTPGQGTTLSLTLRAA